MAKSKAKRHRPLAPSARNILSRAAMKPSAIRPNNGITVVSTSFIRRILSLASFRSSMLYTLESMTGDRNDQEAAARLERARALGSTVEARTLYRDWA